MEEMHQKKHQPRSFEKAGAPIEVYSVNFPAEENSFAFQPNWHIDLEILACTGGVGTVLCNGLPFELQQGDLLVINTNEIHQVLKPDGVFSYDCVIVSGDFCIENGINLHTDLFETIISNPSCFEMVMEVVQMFSRKQDLLYIAKLRLGVLSMLVYLGEHNMVYTAQLDQSAHSKSAKNVLMAIEYIRNHFTEKISIESVAKEIYISKYHLSRIFKELTTYSFPSYVNLLRCRYALKLIRAKQHTISEICTLSGFDSLSYFDKVFRSVFGILPSEVK